MSLKAKMRRQAVATYTLSRYLEEPEEERNKRIQEVCSRCRYVYGHRSGNVFKMLWCNWDSFHAGLIRPCAGRDCVAMGIFEPAEKKNKETVARLLSRKRYAEKRGK